MAAELSSLSSACTAAEGGVGFVRDVMGGSFLVMNRSALPAAAGLRQVRYYGRC